MDRRLQCPEADGSDNATAVAGHLFIFGNAHPSVSAQLLALVVLLVVELPFVELRMIFPLLSIGFLAIVLLLQGFLRPVLPSAARRHRFDDIDRDNSSWDASRMGYSRSILEDILS